MERGADALFSTTGGVARGDTRETTIRHRDMLDILLYPRELPRFQEAFRIRLARMSQRYSNRWQIASIDTELETTAPTADSVC